MWIDVRGDSSFEKKENNCWRLCWDGKETSLIQVPWRKGNCGEMASRYCLLGRSPYLALLRQSYASPVKPAGTTNLIRFNIFNTIWIWIFLLSPPRVHLEWLWFVSNNRISSGRLWYQLPSGECKNSNLDLFSYYYFHQIMIAMLETISALGTKPVSSGRKNLGFQYYWAVGIRNGPWIYSRHIKTLSLENAGRFSTTTTYRLESILAHLEPVMFHTPHLFSVRRSSLCLVYKNCRALCPKKKVLNQGVETPFTNS